MSKPFWVLESQSGWKVVYCPEDFPMGGESNPNWTLIADGLTYAEASSFARRLRA